MLVAIHKKSGKSVSGYMMDTSLEWKGKDKEEFIAPVHEVGNWLDLKYKNLTEVTVSFIKQHKRVLNNGQPTVVCSHFRITTDGAIPYPESEEHKLAKEKIYSLLIEDNISLNIKSLGIKKLTELPEVEDIFIEKGAGYKRADVLIKFKEPHKIYGTGIAFEIQISPQKDTSTLKRSYDRAAYGYSIVWLWDSDIKLDAPTYDLILYNAAIQEYHHQLESEFNECLWDIEERKNETLRNISKEIESELFSFRNQKELLKIEITKSLDNLKGIHEKLEEEAKKEISAQIEEKINLFFKDFQIPRDLLESNISDKIRMAVELKSPEINQQILRNVNVSATPLIEEQLNALDIPKKINQFLETYYSKIKEEVLQRQDFAVEKLKKDFSFKFDTEVKRELSGQLENLCKEFVNAKVKSLLKNEMELLAEESLKKFNESNKLIYCLCSLCKKEKHNSLFKIDSNNQTICLSCFDKKNEEEKTNPN